METVKHLQDFQVVEFRRYTVAPGEREHFTRYFDTYFPEAFEQLGAMVFGQFHERADANHFTWLRGFKDINARPIVNAAFYYGPLWKEHRVKVNAILPDSDNVMLLRPARVDSGVTVLPAVDPVTEPDGAHGIVVAQVFPVDKGGEDAFAARAGSEFAHYATPGVHEARVQVMTCPACVHAHPVPVKLLYWMPVGSVSTTVMPLAVYGPLFFTTRVYVSLVPTAKPALAVFVIWRSATGGPVAKS